MKQYSLLSAKTNRLSSQLSTKLSQLTRILAMLGLGIGSALSLAQPVLASKNLLTEEEVKQAQTQLSEPLEFSFGHPIQAFMFCSAVHNSFGGYLLPYYQQDKHQQEVIFFYKVPKAQLAVEGSDKEFFINRGLEDKDYQALKTRILVGAYNFTDNLSKEGYQVDPNYLYFNELLLAASTVAIKIQNIPAQATIEQKIEAANQTFYYKGYDLQSYAQLLIMGSNKGYLDSSSFKLTNTLLAQNGSKANCVMMGKKISTTKE